MTSLSNNENNNEYCGHREEWKITWNSFKRDLYSTTSDFNAWVWSWRLLSSGLKYIVFGKIVRAVPNCAPCNNIGKILISFIPLFAVCLIGISIASYFLIFRHALIRERWCNKERGCKVWDILHTTLVSYLGLMILSAYLKTCFTSPGVVIASSEKTATSTHSTKTINAKSGDSRAGFYIESVSISRANARQGGIACCNPTIDFVAENYRVSLYGENRDTHFEEGKERNSGRDVFTTDYTFCTKCKIWRPPRCHHCSTCQRCVLQMDHHCPWVNNCIGYNNLRHFFVALTYLVIGCWYGVCLLIVPFYENFQISDLFRLGGRVRDGDDSKTAVSASFILPYQQEQILNYIMYVQLLRTSSEERTKLWIYSIFSLLLLVGVLLFFFWLQHWKQLCRAVTTIENKVLLKQEIVRCSTTSKNNNNKVKIIKTQRSMNNPFSRKNWQKNVYQSLGPSILQTMFVPSFLWTKHQKSVLPPYLPSKKET